MPTEHPRSDDSRADDARTEHTQDIVAFRRLIAWEMRNLTDEVEALRQTSAEATAKKQASLIQIIAVLAAIIIAVVGWSTKEAIRLGQEHAMRLPVTQHAERFLDTELPTIHQRLAALQHQHALLEYQRTQIMERLESFGRELATLRQHLDGILERERQRSPSPSAPRAP